jgi:hypothetical protein
MMSKRLSITGLAILGLITVARTGAAQEVQDAQAEPDFTLPSESITHGESQPQPMESLAPEPPAQPPLQTHRVLGQSVVGLGMGLATTALLFWAGPVDYCLSDCADQPLRKRQGRTGLVAVGMTLCSAAGVTLAGRRGDQTGSFLGAFSGGVLGALAALTLSLAADSDGVDLLLAATLPPLGATIGFNMTRAYDPGKQPGIDVASRRLSGPALVITPDPMHPGTTIKSIRLLGGQF